jgi:hypothetical protein
VIGYDFAVLLKYEKVVFALKDQMAEFTIKDLLDRENYPEDLEDYIHKFFIAFKLKYIHCN